MSDDIELTVEQVKEVLDGVEYLRGEMPPVDEFLDKFHVSALCRDWLKLRARGVSSDDWNAPNDDGMGRT